MSPSSFPLEFNIHPSRRLQIFGLIAEKATIKIPAEYSDFVDELFPDLASELFKQIEINDHAIKLVNDKQLSYGPFYSLEPVELEILKIYIETNLANGFIRLYKSVAGIPILFK